MTIHFDFATGSAGSDALLNLTVATGDILELRMTKQATSPYGDFVGVNMSVSMAVVPEPNFGVIFLLGICLVTLIYRRRSMHRNLF